MEKMGNNFLGEHSIRKKVVSILLGMCMFFMFIFGGCYMLFMHTIGKLNYVPDPGQIVINGNYVEEKNYDPITIMDNNGKIEEIQPASPEKVAEIKQNIWNNIHNGAEKRSSEEVTNILLIGVDKRDESFPGNSDSMILVSANRAKKTVTMTSFLRDLYVGIDERDTYKLNAAHAIGGAPLLVKVIEDNFKIDIDYYVSVDFQGFEAVINILGGVPMEITEEEQIKANEYIRGMNVAAGLEVNTEILNSYGSLVLTGKQALGYARIRSLAGADFQRSNRQRRVLGAVLESARSASFLDITSIANQVAQYVVYNIPRENFMELLMEIPDFFSYQWTSERIPYDGFYEHYNIGGQGMLVPKWQETINQLQTRLYD
ncbi:MAG: LCP family protein [Candidatus Fimimorpha sp.]